MPSSFAVIGPGKVGQALARHWREAGYRLLGFVGRSPTTSAAAVAFAGGSVLDSHAAVARATVVLISVPDAAIGEVARAALDAGAVRPCALWLHTSGVTGLDVLAPLAAAGARIGSMHPLCPVPSASAGYALLPGRLAAIEGPRTSERLLRVLARAAGMRAVSLGATDRVLYHAACALAANGLTVLHALSARWMAAAAPQMPGESAELVASLLHGALAASHQLGASDALTGPAARGDDAALRRHLQAVAAAALPGTAVFKALMGAAAAIAHDRGDLSVADVARVRAALEGVSDG